MADPKMGECPEELQRGLLLLGPYLNDVTQLVNDMNQRLSGLAAAVAKKAELAEVVTLEQFRLLEDELTGKAGAVELTQTAEQLKARIATLEKGITLKAETFRMDEQLQNLWGRVDLLAEKTEVPTLSCFNEQMNKLSCDIDAKDRNAKTLISQLDVCVESLRQQVSSKDDCEEVDRKLAATHSRCLEEITAAKHKQDSVAGNFITRIDAVSSRLENKAEREEVPGLTTFNTEMHRVNNQIQLKADLGWTQEQLRGITDILLPVARAVRGLKVPSGSGQSRAASEQGEPTPYPDAGAGF